MRAGREFWTSHFHLLSWTPEIQERSHSVVSKLLARGTIDKTVLGMSDESIGKATTLLNGFCRLAEDRGREDESGASDASIRN
jgi:hypothetical protein